MKTVSAALKAHLEGKLLTVCTLWKVTRVDGLVFGFTDHDVNVTYNGVTYLAATGHSPSSIKTTAQLSVDNLEVQAMLASSTITEADIYAGLWDYAEVLIELANYNDLTMGSMVLRKGTLGNIKTGRYNFIAELRGMMQPLQQTIGRVYAPGCDADFGDARCGVSGDSPTWNPADKGASITLSAGNLTANLNAVSYHAVRADQYLLSGKFYWEVTFTAGNYLSVGVANSSANVSAATSGTSVTNGWNALAAQNQFIYHSGAIVGQILPLATPLVQGDVVGIAVDTTVGTVAFRRNGDEFTTISGSNIPAGSLYPVVGGQANPPGSAVTANFGETPFQFAPPAGYVGPNNGVLKYTVTGNVTAVGSARQFTDVVRAEANGYFDGGLLTWTSGTNAGRSMEVKLFSASVITLQQAMPDAIAIGDAYSMVAGCDKLRATCVLKFSNVVNFRGFPDLPGRDAIVSGTL